MMAPLSTTHMQIQLRCVLVTCVGHVGLKEGLPVTDGRVDVLKLWLRLNPGDMHADLRELNNACLNKRVDFGQVSPHQRVCNVFGFDGRRNRPLQRGRDLWSD
jgi:hypothetical protein